MMPTGRSERALAVLLAGSILGIVGEMLHVWAPGRLDMACWISVLLLAIIALIRAGVLTASPFARGLAALAVCVIPALIWRDSTALYLLNLLGLAVLLVVAASGAAISALSQIPVSALVRNAAGLGISVALGPLPMLAGDVHWAELPMTARARRLLAIGAGLLAAAPVLVIFGLLLGEADPIFAQTMSRIFSIDLAVQGRHLLLAGLFAWIGVGILRGAFWPERRLLLPEVPRPELSPTASLTFLAAIGCLLAVFVGFQAGELFLGAHEFQAKLGMTISEYARKGFFELVWVATLSLPMLYLTDWGLSRRDPGAVVWFRRIAAGVIVLLTLILASAFHRMMLYGSFYGLTEQRLYTIAFMLWLACVLVWFGATVLRGHRSSFAPGALVAGYITLLTLNLVSPDRLIATVNIDRARGGAPLDRKYLAELSADALPSLVDALPGLPPSEQCQLAQDIRARWEGLQGPTPTWNLSRQEVKRRIEALRAPMPDCTAPGTP